MNLPYIINVALILLACLVFYKLLLRHETFYKVNRYMLIVCLAIAFALPLMQVPQQFSLRKVESQKLKVESRSTVDGIQSIVKNDRQPVNSTQQPANVAQQPTTSSQQTAMKDEKQAVSKFSFVKLMSWLFWIYWFGVAVFGISFLFQVVLLIWRAVKNPFIQDGPYRIVEVNGDKAPCSFANYIFINPEKYDWDTYNQILLHEKIHIREKHTVDNLIAELVLIFQWFDPFALIYSREIESNL